jgi:hypothetical protein
MMADVRELPDLVREFVDMSKEYLRQETLEPAKQLGKFTGFVVGAAICFSLAALFFSVAGLRYIRDALPEGPYWSALAYILAAIALVAVAALLVAFTAREAPAEELQSDPLEELTSSEGS